MTEIERVILKKIIKILKNNGDQNLSYRLYRSDSKEETSDSTEKLVKISSKSPPIEMTNEQHDSFFGNKEEEGR